MATPLIFNKDFGAPLDRKAENFTQANADGEPAVSMSG